MPPDLSLPPLSPYERRALQEIQLWKDRDMGWFDHATERLEQAMRRVTDLARNVPGVDYAIDNVITGLLRLTNEITQDTVSQAAIYRTYGAAGHAVAEASDIHRLDLEHIDDRLAGLDVKYRGLAAAEGAATGFAGASGIIPDIVALVALNLRAAGEHAAYCGFDLRDPAERLYALQLLNAVTGPTDVSKPAALVPVIHTARELARNRAAYALEQHMLTRAIRNAARALGVRLTRAKLAQAIPFVGAAIGSSFNAYYTSKVCDAAFYLYRERFLFAKYGDRLETTS